MRFAWIYAAFSLAAIVIVIPLQMSGNTGLAVGILMASAVAAGQKFVADQKRVFRTSEKLRMSFYSLLTAFLFSLALAFAILSWAGIGMAAFYDELSGSLSTGLIAGIAGLAILVNYGVLYLAYSFVLNMIYKGMVRRGEV